MTPEIMNTQSTPVNNRHTLTLYTALIDSTVELSTVSSLSIDNDRQLDPGAI